MNEEIEIVEVQEGRVTGIRVFGIIWMRQTGSDAEQHQPQQKPKRKYKRRYHMKLKGQIVDTEATLVRKKYGMPVTEERFNQVMSCLYETKGTPLSIEEIAKRTGIRVGPVEAQLRYGQLKKVVIRKDQEYWLAEYYRRRNVKVASKSILDKPEE